MSPPRDKDTPQRADLVPHGQMAAAQELILSLARMTQERDSQPTNNTYTRDREAITHLLRALTGLFQLEGGRISVQWLNKQPTVNELQLADTKEILHASLRLRERLGGKGIAGIVFRLIPDADQIRHFFRRLVAMEPAEVHKLGEPGEVVNLPDGPQYNGIQLLLGVPGQLQDSQPGFLSGFGVRATLEETLNDLGMGWIGTQPLPGEDEEVSDGDRVSACLGSYVNLTSTALRLVRASSDLRAGVRPLPTLALLRSIQQISQCLDTDTGLLQACMLLAARDPSPSRRIAHTVLTAMGLATHQGARRRALAEIGMAAFAYGLRERFTQLVRVDERRDWEILHLLTQEPILTSLKVRAIHTAALVGANTDQEQLKGLKTPSMSKLIHLSADFAGHIDGTMSGKLPHAPLPAAVALQDLSRRLDRVSERLSWERPHLMELAAWLGPTPPGTIVRLPDRRTAVIAPSRGIDLVALPILEANAAAIRQPSAPVILGKRLDQTAWNTDLKILGVSATRPLVHLAAQALFHSAQDQWRAVL